MTTNVISGKGAPAKKDIKKSLKGVLVKKKPKDPTTKKKRSVDDEFQSGAKRRKVVPVS